MQNEENRTNRADQNRDAHKPSTERKENNMQKMLFDTTENKTNETARDRDTLTPSNKIKENNLNDQRLTNEENKINIDHNIDSEPGDSNDDIKHQEDTLDENSPIEENFINNALTDEKESIVRNDYCSEGDDNDSDDGYEDYSDRGDSDEVSEGDTGESDISDEELPVKDSYKEEEPADKNEESTDSISTEDSIDNKPTRQIANANRKDNETHSHCEPRSAKHRESISHITDRSLKNIIGLNKKQQEKVITLLIDGYINTLKTEEFSEGKAEIPLRDLFIREMKPEFVKALLDIERFINKIIRKTLGKGKAARCIHRKILVASYYLLQSDLSHLHREMGEKINKMLSAEYDDNEILKREVEKTTMALLGQMPNSINRVTMLREEIDEFINKENIEIRANKIDTLLDELYNSKVWEIEPELVALRKIMQEAIEKHNRHS